MRAYGSARSGRTATTPKPVSELGITARDLRVTLEDTVRWLADQGHLSIKRPAEKD
jgi:hypothetical protein